MRTVLSREGALPGTASGRQIDSVWWIDGESASPRGGLLDPYEMQRAHEVRDPHACQLYVVTQETARVALAQLSGLAPAGLVIDRVCTRCGRQHGQPRPAGVPGSHLSVSYSGHLTVVAATRGRAIGVDIEDRRRAVPAATRQRIESELGITSGHAPGCDGGFIESWSRAEAVLKSQGKGILSLGRRAPRVPGRGSLPWTDVATRAEGILIDVSPDADHTASVAINGSADVSIVQGPAHDLMSSHGL